MLLSGLGWLLVTYSEWNKELGSILKYIMAGVTVVVIAMLALSAWGIGQAILGRRGHIIVDILPWPIALSMFAAVWVKMMRSRSLGDTHIHRAVHRAAMTSMVIAIISALLTGITSATSTKLWSHPPVLIVCVAIALSMIVPAIALVASVPPAMAAVRGGLVSKGARTSKQSETNSD
jgi:hypothetical protein